MRVEIWTDGACLDNGKDNAPGGWAAVLRAYEDKDGRKIVKKEKVLSGHKIGTTNNQMELTAVLMALKELDQEKTPENGYQYHIYSDSRYVINCFTKWVETWIDNYWINSRREPVKNIRLIEEIYNLCRIFRPQFHWVKGHANSNLNNRADEIAIQERNKAARMKRRTFHDK